MAMYDGSIEIDASPSTVIDYLADVSHLPDYFPTMTRAEPVGRDDSGRTTLETAAVVDGTERAGRAWIEVDEGARHLAWGGEGSSDYHGSLDVSGDGQRSRLALTIHTDRVGEGDEGVQQGVDRALASIKAAVEG